VAPRRWQRPASALSGYRGRVSTPGAGYAWQGDAGGGGLPAAGSVGHDPSLDQRPLRHRDSSLLLHSTHSHSVCPECDLQRSLSGGDQGAISSLVERQRRRQPECARGRADGRAHARADRPTGKGCSSGCRRTWRRKESQPSFSILSTSSPTAGRKIPPFSRWPAILRHCET
jgi:hypothetical protein